MRKANARAAIHYVPRPFDGRLTYVRAIHAGTVYANAERWAALAADVDVINIAGGHSDVRQEPQVQIVAQAIHERIARARDASPVT